MAAEEAHVDTCELQSQSNAAWGTSPVEVTIAVGTLRVFGKCFAICTGTILRLESDAVALLLSSPGHVGSYTDLLFKVGTDGVTSADLDALMAGVAKSPKQQGAQDGGTFLEECRPKRYPDVRNWSGGVVICCTCERREARMSSSGAIILHATALRCIDMSSATLASQVENPMSMAPKTDRHTIFASWILDTFGGLAAVKGGVVDVAGGKGHLSNAITAHGVPCTLVDPFAGLGRDPVAGIHAGDGCAACAGLLLDPRVRCVKATLQDAAQLVPGLVAKSSAVVALHPDEATEPTIDAARHAKRPFAVVPCCVFRKQFPGRRLNNGAAVRKYGSLLRYFREKDPRIRSCRLPFAGRNVVLYMTAADFLRPEKHSSTCFSGGCNDLSACITSSDQ